MQQRAFLTVVIALCAAAAFAVGATVFDDALAHAGPSVGDGDVPTRNASSSGGGRKRGSRGTGRPGRGGCLLCGLSARSLVGGLFPAVGPLALAGLAALAVAAATLLGLRPGDGRTSEDDGVEGDEERDDTTEGPTAAGPSGAATTNEVYRAWATLTGRVEMARPESATPGEYARAAIAAGLDRETVERLTDLFEAVRYGGAPATAERERDAREAVEKLDDAPAADDGEEGARS